MRRAALFALLACGCVERPPKADGGAAAASAKPAAASAPAPTEDLPGKRRDVTDWIGGASRLAAGDLDGDGRSEIVVADSDRVWVLDGAGQKLAESAAPAGIQVLEVIDADGDGKREIACGWGETGPHRGAPASVSLLRLQSGHLAEEIVSQPKTSRAEIVAILPDRGGLFLAWFDSKYTVASGWASRTAGTGWAVQSKPAIRMATTWAFGDVDGDKTRDLLIARVYGDAKDVDGDAFWLTDGGDRRLIPTTRGARGLVAADSDGDGRDEVFVADGWHQNYGKFAKGLLTWAVWKDGKWDTVPLDDAAGQFTLGRLLAGDLDGDGHLEIVAQGSSCARVYRRKGAAWTSTTVARTTRDLAIVDGRLLTAADKSELIDLRGALP